MSDQLPTDPTAITPEAILSAARSAKSSGELVNLLAVLSYSEQHSHIAGTLPPPEMLKGFEEASKGSAKRILDLAAQQAEHRQKLEWHAIQRDSRRADWGLLAGFFLCLTSLVSGTVAICLGHDFAGATVATGSLIGLAGVFIYGTNARAAERTAKRNQLTGRSAPDKRMARQGDTGTGAAS